MNHLSDEFIKANKNVLQTWAAFVLKSEEKGETPLEIRARLLQNKLSEEQVLLLLDKRAREKWPAKNKRGSLAYKYWAIVFLITSLLFFYLELPVKDHIPFKGIINLIFAGFCWAKYHSKF